MTRFIYGKNPWLNNIRDRVGAMSRYVKAELDMIHPRLFFVQTVMMFMPLYFGSRLRAILLSLIGFDIGDETVFWGKPIITGKGNLYKRLHIGCRCWINDGCFLDLGETITIGDNVSIGQQVLFITSSHKLGPSARRAGPLIEQPIRIGHGVWLGARCTILPGVTVHDGAVVGAGAVVTKDVPANTLVAGVPAVFVRRLEDEPVIPVHYSLETVPSMEAEP